MTYLTPTQIAEAAEKHGIPEQHVQELVLELKKLREQGSLLSVSIHGVSQLFGRAALRDYGVGATDVRRNRLSAGLQKLFSQDRVKEINNAEKAIRWALDKYSFDVDAFRPFRYMLDSARPIWQAEHEQRVARFQTAVDALCNAYEDEKAHAAEEYAEMAAQSWKGLRATAKKDELKKEAKNEASYIKTYVEIQLGRLPSVEALRRALRVEIHAGVLVHPGDIEVLLQQREQVKFEATERRRIQTEQLRDELTRIESPWSQVLGEYEAQLYEQAKDLLDKIGAQGSLRNTQKEKLERMKAMYEVMAVSKSEPIEQALSMIERALTHLTPEEVAAKRSRGEPRVKFDMQAITGGLQALAEATHQSAQEMLQRRPSPFAGLEL